MLARKSVLYYQHEPSLYIGNRKSFASGLSGSTRPRTSYCKRHRHHLCACIFSSRHLHVQPGAWPACIFWLSGKARVCLPGQHSLQCGLHRTLFHPQPEIHGPGFAKTSCPHGENPRFPGVCQMQCCDCGRKLHHHFRHGHLQGLPEKAGCVAYPARTCKAAFLSLRIPRRRIRKNWEQAPFQRKPGAAPGLWANHRLYHGP